MTEHTPKTNIESLIGSMFIQRRDVKAFQREDGSYKPIPSRWTKRDIRNHLDERVTLGHYLVDKKGKTKVLAFDVDFDKDYTLRSGEIIHPRDVFSDEESPHRTEMVRSIRCLADGLAWMIAGKYRDIKVLTAFSGSKGIHVYGCLGGSASALAARDLGLTLLTGFAGGDWFIPDRGQNFFRIETHPGMTIEVFPKQESIGSGGFGNLLRLPLGVNQKTGKQGFFYDPFSPLDELEPADPIDALVNGSIRPRGQA